MHLLRLHYESSRVLIKVITLVQVIGTFSGLGAAGVSASVLTTILPSTIEDLIALGVCSAGG